MTKKTILLIDECKVVMDLTKRMLERVGHSVRVAESRSEALEFLQKSTPDCIVLDIRLPDIDGLDYCRELRRKSDVPILFISCNKDDEVPALHAGANDFMKSPFNYDVLKARLSVMLSGRCQKAIGESASPD